jgi:hypothetical protein
MAKPTECPACHAYIGYDRSRIHEHPCTAYAPMAELPRAQHPPTSAPYRNTDDGLARYRRGIK